MVKKKFLKRCSILMCSVLVAANLVACGAGTGSANEEVKQSAYSQDNMVQTSIEKRIIVKKYTSNQYKTGNGICVRGC